MVAMVFHLKIAPLSQFWSFRPHTQEWRKLAPLPTARHHMAVTAVDNKVYACGGLQGREGATDLVEVGVQERNSC